MRLFLRLGNRSCVALPPASLQSFKMIKNPVQFGYIHSWISSRIRSSFVLNKSALKDKKRSAHEVYEYFESFRIAVMDGCGSF